MNDSLKRFFVPALLVLPMLSSIAGAVSLAIPAEWKGTITSITYNGSGQASGFKLTATDGMVADMKVHEPSEALTELLQRLKDDKKDVTMEDGGDDIYGNQDNDSITE